MEDNNNPFFKLFRKEFSLQQSALKDSFKARRDCIAKQIASVAECSSPGEFIQKGIEQTKEYISKQVAAAKGKGNPFTDFIARIPEDTRFIVLTDIVNFSTKDSRTQVSYIYMFQMYVRYFTMANQFDFKNRIRVTNFVPTGDGCYMVADECDPRTAVDFLLALVSGFQEVRGEKGESIPIRVSGLIGKCIPFMDITMRKNYMGDGMNEAQRILSCGQHAAEDALRGTGDDVNRLSADSLYLGDSLASSLTDEQISRADRVMRFADVPDKHGITRNITVLQGVHAQSSGLLEEGGMKFLPEAAGDEEDF